MIAELVAKLIAAGTPAELAAVVVTEAFAAGALCGNSGGIPVDAAAEKRRAYDRERKRNKKNSGGIPVENPRNSNPPLNLTSSSESQEHSEKQENKKVRARKAPAQELPPDWQPKPAHHEAATKLGLRLVQVEMKADDMRIWAKANGARKVDWDATFHGFLRRDARGNHERAGQTRTNTAARPAATNADAILAGMARVAEKRFGSQSANQPGDGAVRGFDDTAGGTDAEPGATGGDRGTLPQLKLVAGSNSG